MHWLKLIIAVLLLTCVAGVLMASQWFLPTRFASLQLLPEARAVPGFNLMDASGGSFTEQDLKGKWSLVFFGYRHCIDVCPIELQIFNQVLKKNPQGLQAIFISLDPERDSLKSLGGFTASFHPAIKAVTGNNSTLAKLTRSFGTDYHRTINSNDGLVDLPSGYDLPPGSAKDYIVQHPNRIFLVNSLGMYIGSFSSPQNAEIISADLQMIIKR